VDDGHRLASYDTSLVVSGGVDCGRRRRNVYDKKPRRYAKDNRTVHLTARSDKSVVYVTNNKTLRCVLLKLITDRYEASRGLFATADLLVFSYKDEHLTLSSTGLKTDCGKVSPW